MELVLKLNDSKIEEFVKKVDFEKGKGLVPAIIQDASNNRVLMEGYVNEESLRLTLKSGKMHFWSRSRGRIWLKGEESGHNSLLQNAILDCDNDAILFKVQQIGSICHTGKETCFHNSIVPEKEIGIDSKIIERIFEIIENRINYPTENSYISSLTSKGEDVITRKIEKATVELANATINNNIDDIVSKATDVFFHILILLAKKDIKIQKIFEKMEQQHQSKTVYKYTNKD